MSPWHREAAHTEAQREMAERCRVAWGLTGMKMRSPSAPIPITLQLWGDDWIHLILRDRRTMDLLRLREETWFLEDAKYRVALRWGLRPDDCVVRFVVWPPDLPPQWIEVDDQIPTFSRKGTMLRKGRNGETADPGWYIPWDRFRAI